MKLARSHGQRCTFRVNCHQAHQASLVIDIFPGMPQIFSLQRAGEGVWETELRLHPGEYRFCYHLYDGRSLQYVTPAGMKTDGLKAVLHVEALPEPTEHDAAPAGPKLLHRPRLTVPVPPGHCPGAPAPGMLRRAAS